MKPVTLASLLAAVGLFVSAGAGAQTAADRAYVIDSRNEVAKSGFGLCWRDGYWTPAAAAIDPAGCGCDPDLLSKAQCEPVVALKSAPAVAAPKKCDFTAVLKDDQVFAFNKAVLRPAATAALDREVLGKLANCAELNLVVVTGHTDRLGDQSYNQKLSEKRADVVKAYLVGKGVNADVVDTMGAGKTQPVPGLSCKDGLPRQKLIECLAPNRRTVVEVRGPAK